MNDRADSLLDRLRLLAYRDLLRPRFFAAGGGDPEVVHEAMLTLLGRAGESAPLRGLARLACGGPRRPVEFAGVEFAGPVVLAAGLDKNGEAARLWGSLGFGGVELGTVTASSQPGSPRPRLFRLPSSGAVVNRMGFNNRGAAALAERLERWGVRRGNRALGVPVGVSIGKTRTTPLERAGADYLESFALVAPHADYVAVNVSSPNTPGLRRLQDAEALGALVRSLVDLGRTLDASAPMPVVVKIAPDLGDEALDQLVDVAEDAGAAGLVATNTTLRRTGLDARDAALAEEPGGLSGAPLTLRAREVVTRVCARTALPVMGVGGVMTPADATALFDAGARLVQVYTGWIYAGPALVTAINRSHARSAA